MGDVRLLRRGMTLILNALAATAGFALMSASQIQAQSLYWDANGTTTGTGATSTSTWDTTLSNWSTDSTGVAAPGLWADGNIAVFSAGTDGTGIQTITVSGTINPLGITVEEGAVNLSGGTLDLGGDVVSVATGTSSISSVVSGSGILTKSGGGTLILSGSNTFTGTMTTGAGILRATTSASALGTGAATVNLNGGTLWLANDSTTPLAFNRNTTISTATTVTLGRLTAGNGGQTFAMGTLAMGSAILTVNADSTTLNVTNNAATTLTFGATTFSADATFNIVNSTASGGNTTVSLGAITNDGTARNLIKTGNGRLTLTAANSYGGKTSVTGGLLSIAAEAALGAAPTPDAVADQLTLNGGGLEISNSIALNVNRGITLGSAHGTLDVNSGLTLTVNGVVTGTGNLIKADSGILVLTAANTYTGTTVVAGGTLRLDQDIASGASSGHLGSSTAAIQVASASLITSGSYTISRGVQVNASGGITTLGTQAATGTTTFNGNITNNNSGNSQQLNLRAEGTSTVVFNGIISGNSNNNFDGDSSVYTSSTGTGTVVLGGNNTYRGYTQVSTNTTLVARHNNALGTGTTGISFGTGVVAGATLELQNNITTPEEIIINGTGVASAGALKSSGGNNSVSGPVTLGSAATVNSATAGQTLILAGNVKADYALAVTGAGNTIISGVVSGQTGYVAGLKEGRVTAGSSFNTTTVNPGGAQVLSAIAGYSADKTTAGKWADQETWVYTGQFFDADGKFAFAENIDDSVQIIVDGKVVLTNSTYNVVTTTNSTTANGAPAGNITSDFGMGTNGDGWHTIEIRFGNGGGGAGPVVGSGWTSTFGFGYNPMAGGTPVVSFNASDYLKLQDDGSGTLLRTQVSNSLNKTGTGILTLSNANTYDGPTTVTQGTLLVTNLAGSGTGTGAVSVASGGSLGGTGRIAGSTVVSVGGRLIMGADTAAVGTDFGIGTLTFDSSLTVSGTINFDLASSTVFDKLSVGGLLSLDANTIINVNLGTFTPTGSEVFDIIDASSIALNGFNPDSLGDLVLPSLAPGYQWDTTRFASDGIIAIAVPEPSRMILFFMGFAALVLRRKRAKG